ncbi:hypothetical protein MY5147_003380 [Beauveria neobassiana]
MDEPPALTWRGSYALLPLEASNGSSLNGDKIILPQSALEQLLSASASQAVMQDKYTTASSHLPNPLTFRLVNPTCNKSVYAGIREFSAPEGTVILSPYLLSALGLATDEKATTTSANSTVSQIRLEVHTETLPKGTYARLRPLEAGYNPDDWRPLLERQLQRDFTSLTKNAKILVHGVRGEVFQLLVDKLSPEGQGVCVVDTDLEVDIEALDEEQARETLRQFINTNRHENQDGSSKGGPIDIWKPVLGKIAVGSYIDYSLPSWDRNQSVKLTLSNMSDPEALELFVTPKSNLQRALPRKTEYVFSTLGSFESSTTKTIIISPTDAEMKKAESIQISVHAYSDFTATKAADAIQYTLRAQVLVESDKTIAIDQAGNLKEQQENEALCSNCQQLVPKQSLVLHENFCRRNNIVCPKCKLVFKKDSAEFAAHWHCEQDEAYGNTPYSKQKHDEIFHSSWLCSSIMGNSNTRESRPPGASDYNEDYRSSDGRSRHRAGRVDASFLGLGTSSQRDRRQNVPFEHRETKQEREARRLERERVARAKERERSLREEHVDGGYLVTLGTYVGTEDFNKPVVRQLQSDRAKTRALLARP